MIAELRLSVLRHAFRNDRAASLERNYLCTFLNDQGERVDVFENLGGAMYFLTHHRESSAAGKREQILQVA